MSPAGRLLVACVVGTLAALPGCSDQAPAAPRVDAVSPARTCDVAAGATRILRVAGQGLAPRVVDTLTGGARLVLPTVTVRRSVDEAGQAVSGEAPVGGLTPRFLASGAIELTLPAGLVLGRGQYDVTVTDEDGHAATKPRALTIAAPPAAFYVDPRTVYAGASFGLVGWLDAPGTAATRVSVQRHADPASRRELTPLVALADRSRFEATLPAELAEGDYDVIVESEGGCVGESAQLLHVQEQLTTTSADLEPDTGTVNGAFPVGLSGSGFVPTPRLFLRAAGDRRSTATPLVALDWQAGSLVEAVVPQGPPAGVYDLVVIAADGTVALVAGALTLVSSKPLDIATVTPEVMPIDTSVTLAIHGQGFDAPTVRLRCRKNGTGAVAAVQLQVASANATDIVAVAPASPTPAVCVVRVANGSGGVAQYSAVAYTDGPTEAELVQMPVARRSAAAAVGRLLQRHVLYVFGGDGGAPASALASVDSCKFDLFGRPGQCKPQRSQLSVPRSGAGGARVGRFVYAVGGENASGALRSVERARMLDPADAPAMAGYDLALADGTHGLGGGQWLYRISAVLDENDLDDPHGESLASQPALVVVPERPERVTVQLAWAPVAHAERYRVYRTPVGNAASGEELLVFESADAATTWTDAGEPAAGAAPLKPLQLGAWHDITALAVPRAGAAVVAARDPQDPDVTYLYVAGGRDASGAPRDDFEWFTLTEVGAGRQRVTGPTMGGSIGGARARLAAWSVTGAEVPALGGDTWIYLGGGEGAAGARVSTTVAGKVGAGGQVSFATMVNGTPVPQTGGAGAVVQRTGLVVLGGGGNPSRGGASADVCSGSSGAGCGNGAIAPELGNWSSLGGNVLARARYLMATVRSGPFVFVAGGQSDTEAATTSVEGGAW